MRFRDWLGEKIHGTQYNIDLINACSLKCPSCAVGSIGGRKGGYMSIDLFRRILDKAQREGKVRRVQFYAYSDPCLHPGLDLFVQECTDRRIPSYISTVLQKTNCDFQKVIEAGPTEFRISFPGWEKMEYYQRNARPEVFDRKIEEVCSLPRHPETTWTMAFHLYNDNAHEVPRARELAARHGLKLVVLPAIWMVLDKMVEGDYSDQDRELISHLIETPEVSVARMDRRDDCFLHKQVTIDAVGDVYLCQLLYRDKFRLVPFLDVPLREVQRQIRTHPFCSKCMEKGGQVYQACFADFISPGDPISKANRKRHKIWPDGKPEGLSEKQPWHLKHMPPPQHPGFD